MSASGDDRGDSGDRGDRRELRLERWYRRLLRAYPARFREERAEEIVTTLLAAGKPGRLGLPSLRDAVDLVANGLRTRVRVVRRTLAAPRTAAVVHDAGLVVLPIAAAAAVALIVAVTVLGRPMFDPGRNFNHTYPLVVRLGLGAVLATFPAALRLASVGRVGAARRLVLLGAVGSVGFAGWLIAYAHTTRNEMLAVSDLFGLVTLLCLPALLLRDAGGPRAVLRAVRLAALLAVPLVFQVADHHPDDDGRGLEDPALLSSRFRLGAVHDTGLTEMIVAILVVVAAWHLVRRRYRPDEPRHLIVVWAVAVPAWGYAFGTFLTPLLYRPEDVLLLPGQSRLAALGPQALELGAASVVVAGLAVVALGALERGAGQTVSGDGR